MRVAPRKNLLKTRLCLVIGVAVLGACGAETETARVEPTPSSAALDPALAKGRHLFKQCAQCHTLADGAPHRLGPNLWGVFGREVGGREDYRYSQALREAEFVWSADDLDQWLADPNGFLPGNAMRFLGFRKPEDRAALIAYLKAETGALAQAEPVAVDAAPATTPPGG